MTRARLGRLLEAFRAAAVRRRAIVCTVFLCASCATATVSAADPDAESQTPRAPRLWLNESLVSGLHDAAPVDEPMAVFAMVFESLPREVTIYPSENYYYFHFAANGALYSGNFRLSMQARAERKVHFAYFDTADPMGFRHLYLGDADGVAVRERTASRFDIAYAGRTVTFVINEVPQALGDFALRPHERYIGRTLDESGLSLLLLYDTQTRGFVWVLDESGPVRPQLVALTPELLLDGRTYFVFHDDAVATRRTLIGVRHENIASNSIYDGPFDQLPDEHLDATDFATYMLEAYPGLSGVVNARGEVDGGDSRLGLTPYRMYLQLQDLISWVEQCRLGAGADAVQLRRCLFWDYQQALYASSTD